MQNYVGRTGKGQWAERPTGPADRSSKLGINLPDQSIVITLIVVQVLRLSHLHFLFGEWAFQLLLAIELTIYAYYVGLSAMSRAYRAIILSITYVAFLILQVLNFSDATQRSVNVNAIFEYIPIFSVFVLYQTSVSARYIQKVLAYTCAIYLVGYVVFYDQLLALAPQDSSLMRPASAGRPDRLSLATGLATFALILGLYSFRRAPVFGAILAVFASLAILNAESRAFTASILIGLVPFILGSLAPQLRNVISLGVTVVFLMLSVYQLAPIVGFDYNPYSPLIGDASGWARYLEYADGMAKLSDRWLVGVGIPETTEALQAYVNPVRPFFTSDLGVFGIAFNFGIVFCILYLVLSVLLITYPARSERGTVFLPLFYTVQMQAFLGFFAANILNSTTTIFVALSIALWFKHSDRLRLSQAARA